MPKAKAKQDSGPAPVQVSTRPQKARRYAETEGRPPLRQSERIKGKGPQGKQAVSKGTATQIQDPSPIGTTRTKDIQTKKKKTALEPKTIAIPRKEERVPPRRSLRKREKAERKSDLTSAPLPNQSTYQSLSRQALEAQNRELSVFDHNQAPTDGEESTTVTPSTESSEPDLQDVFNHLLGYLPPFDDDIADIIDKIIQDPLIAKDMARIGPEKAAFMEGLIKRGVDTEPSFGQDQYMYRIMSADLRDLPQESSAQKQSHGQLWEKDLAKCNEGSNEGIFQRTVMISLLSRHLLIYKDQDSGTRSLDFNTEEPWSCPPMPTGILNKIKDAKDAAKKKVKLLAQPKPDLTVCFHRESVIPKDTWLGLPAAPRALAVYEKMTSNQARIFHFLTVEGKKAANSVENAVGLYQSLNNASQSLYNIFEFFRDAGEKHERNFFEKVRFFSVVATGQGLIIRIHRAIRLPKGAKELNLVMPKRPDYPLRFHFENYERIDREKFSQRERVLEIFKRIFKYAVEELQPMISAAAADLFERLNSDENGVGDLVEQRGDIHFYRYGQLRPEDLKPDTRNNSVAPPSSLHSQPPSISEDMGNAHLTSFSAPSESVAHSTRRTTKAAQRAGVVDAGRPRKRRPREDSDLDNDDIVDSQQQSTQRSTGSERQKPLSQESQSSIAVSA